MKKKKAVRAVRAKLRGAPQVSVKKPSVSAAKTTRTMKAREISRPSPRSTPRRELYPALEPYRHGYLRVSDIHEIYYEESGNQIGRAHV